MRLWLVWTARIIVFVFLLVLALMNSASVQLSFFFGLRWEIPLALLLLIFLTFGAALGVLSMLGKVWCLKREISQLKQNNQ